MPQKGHGDAWDRLPSAHAATVSFIARGTTALAGVESTCELREHRVQVRLQPIVGSDQHCKAILVHSFERLRRVDAALVEDRVDRIACDHGGSAVGATVPLQMAGGCGMAPKNSLTISTLPFREMVVLAAVAVAMAPVERE